MRVDDVDFPGDFSSDDSLVATFVIPIDSTQITNGSMIYHDIRYQGSFLGLSFTMACAPNFYGEDCATICIQRDDTSGHYICDSEGSIKCMAGYQNTLSNCTECSLAPGCCKCVPCRCETVRAGHMFVTI